MPCLQNGRSEYRASTRKITVQVLCCYVPPEASVIMFFDLMMHCRQLLLTGTRRIAPESFTAIIWTYACFVTSQPSSDMAL